MATRVPGRRQQVARVREIAQIATRHGFGYAFERRPWGRKSVEEPLPVMGRRLRDLLDELGPTFVKFGQLLSTRPDVVPAEIADELRKLQDHVRPFPWEQVEQMIESELHAPVDSLFTRFEREPVAAASIGQVHQAELASGRLVAVKVQRPVASQQIESDLALLYQLARIVKRRVERLQFIDTVGVVDEFARSIRRELDYRIEAGHGEVFRRNFAADPRVAVPKVFRTYSSERVLTTEWLEGPKLGELDLVATGMSERRRVAVLIAEVWMEMVFRHGTFHGDPHPANLFVLPDGRLGLIDFGMVGTLSEADMRRLTRLLIDAVNENVDDLPRRLHDLGVRFSPEQEDDFRVELREVFYRYHGASLGEIDPLAVIREAFTLIYKMNLRLPTRFVLLDKTLATLGSVGAEVYPDFNVFEVAEPYAAELLARRYSPRAIADRGLEELRDLTDVAMELPDQVHDVLEQLRDGEFEVKINPRGLDELIGQADAVINRMVVAVVMAAMIVGSALILALHGGGLDGVQLLGLVGFLASAGLGAVLVVAVLRTGRL